MNDLNIIFYWPDGTWCFSDEYSDAEHGFKGDDFGIFTAEQEITAEQIEMEIANRLK